MSVCDLATRDAASSLSLLSACPSDSAGLLLAVRTHMLQAMQPVSFVYVVSHALQLV